MNLTRFAIRRPIFTTMVTLIVVIVGAIALIQLPVDLMPDITNPIVSIRTEYENASPEVVEELVTRPIEEAMAAVPGAEEVTSNSSEGNSNVVVRFSWATDIDVAVSDVRDRIDRVINRLPDDCDRPTLFKFDFSAMPILFIGISSEMDPVEMRRLIDDQIKFRIESINGVASMSIFGGREREIAVDVDPYRLRAMGVSLTRVMDVLRRRMVHQPSTILTALEESGLPDRGLLLYGDAYQRMKPPEGLDEALVPYYPRKSLYINSTTGREPISAEPSVALTKPFSDIGA